LGARRARHGNEYTLFAVLQATLRRAAKGKQKVRPISAVGSARPVEEKQHEAPELLDMKHWGVDEVDVYRIIRRVRLGKRAVVRVVVNPGGNAGDKAPPRLER
jgi:hypothetical protein